MGLDLIRRSGESIDKELVMEDVADEKRGGRRGGRGGRLGGLGGEGSINSLRAIVVVQHALLFEKNPIKNQLLLHQGDRFFDIKQKSQIKS